LTSNSLFIITLKESLTCVLADKVHSKHAFTKYVYSILFRNFS